MFKWVKKMFKKADDVRERIEDVVATVLDKAQASERLDEIEKKAIAAGVKAGLVYFTGSCALSDEQLNQISAPIVDKGINTLNPKLAKILRYKKGELKNAILG